MRFNEHQGNVRMPSRALAVVTAGGLALGVGLGVAYEFVHEFNETVNSVIGFAESGKPKANVGADVQTAAESVQVPTAMPILEAYVSSGATVNTFTSVWGIQLPWFGHNGSVSQSGYVGIMAPEDALTKRQVYELADSTTADPKFGVTLTVDVDTLYPQISDPTIDGASDGADFFSRVGNDFTNNDPSAKDTAVAINVDNSYMEVNCAQTIAPRIQTGIQQAFYEDAQSEPDIAPLDPTDRSLVTKYYSELADQSIPVQVELVNNKGQDVPTTFTLNDASYLMSKQKIAHDLGVSLSNSTFKFSSLCLSTPKAVQDQIMLANSYAAHSGESATAALADNVTDNG